MASDPYSRILAELDGPGPTTTPRSIGSTEPDPYDAILGDLQASPAPHPPEQPQGFFNRAAGAIGDFADTVGSYVPSPVKAALQAPGAATGLLGMAADPEAYWSAYDRNLSGIAQGAPSASEAIRAAPGLGSVLRESIAPPQGDSGWGDAALGLGATGVDILTDPSTYLTGGLGQAGRLGKLAATGVRAAEIAPDVSRMGAGLEALSRVIGSPAAGLVYGPELIGGTARAIESGDYPEAIATGGLGYLIGKGIHGEYRNAVAPQRFEDALAEALNQPAGEPRLSGPGYRISEDAQAASQPGFERPFDSPESLGLVPYDQYIENQIRSQAQDAADAALLRRTKEFDKNRGIDRQIRNEAQAAADNALLRRVEAEHAPRSPQEVADDFEALRASQEATDALPDVWEGPLPPRERSAEDVAEDLSDLRTEQAIEGAVEAGLSPGGEPRLAPPGDVRLSPAAKAAGEISWEDAQAAAEQDLLAKIINERAAKVLPFERPQADRMAELAVARQKAEVLAELGWGPEQLKETGATVERVDEIIRNQEPPPYPRAGKRGFPTNLGGKAQPARLSPLEERQALAREAGMPEDHPFFPGGPRAKVSEAPETKIAPEVAKQPEIADDFSTKPYLQAYDPEKTNPFMRLPEEPAAPAPRGIAEIPSETAGEPRLAHFREWSKQKFGVEAPIGDVNATRQFREEYLKEFPERWEEFRPRTTGPRSEAVPEHKLATIEGANRTDAAIAEADERARELVSDERVKAEAEGLAKVLKQKGRLPPGFMDEAGLGGFRKEEVAKAIEIDGDNPKWLDIRERMRSRLAVDEEAPFNPENYGPPKEGESEFYATTAYHGSGADFDRFDSSKIGTGEGHQAFSHGLYFASREAVGDHYRRQIAGDDEASKVLINGTNEASIYNGAYPLRGELNEADLKRGLGHIVYYARLYKDPEYGLKEARRTANALADTNPDAAAAKVLFDKADVKVQPRVRRGKMYKVELAPDEADYLDWDTPFSQQSDQVKKAVRSLIGNNPEVSDFLENATGETIYKRLIPMTRDFAAGRDPADISKALREAGVPGVRYLDSGSRDIGSGSHNYVIFDDSLATIKEKYATGRPGQRGLPGIADDVPQRGQRPSGPEQQSMFKGEMLQPSASRTTEGREGEGRLFTQDADARARDEAKSQRPMFRPGNPFTEKARRARELSDRLNQPTAHERGMAEAFPLGAGFGRGSAHSRAKSVDASVDRSVRAVQAVKDAEHLEAQARAFDAGEINAQGRRVGRNVEADAEGRANRADRVAAAREIRGNKEPWEVTRSVYADASGQLRGSARGLVEYDHGAAVARAVAEGKSVPPEVLADYPDLSQYANVGRSAEVPTNPLTLESVKAGVPGLEFKPHEDGSYRAALKSGGEVRISQVGEIEIRDPRAVKLSMEASGLSGKQKPVGVSRFAGRQAIVQIAEGAPEGTIDHEAFHVMSRLALNEKERGAFLKHYGGEEPAAYAYAKWAKDRKAPNSWFSRIMAYAKRLVHRFRPTWESTFEEVASGRAGRRVGGEAEGEAFATAPSQPPTARPRPTAVPPPQKKPQRAFSIPEETALQKLQRVFQDRENRVGVVQKTVAKQGGKIREETDVAAALDAFGPKIASKIENVDRQFVDPLVTGMAKSKVAIEDLGDYMGLQGRGSEWDTGEASTRWSELERKYGARQGGKIAGLESHADTVRKLNDATLDELVDGGLLSKAQAQAWRTSGTVNKGFDIQGRQSPHGASRSTKTENPVSFAVNQHHQALVAAEKNRTHNALAKLIQENPDPKLWAIDAEHKVKKADASGNVKEVRDSGADLSDLSFKTNGESHRITLNDPLLKRAVENLSAKETGEFVRKIGTATRLYSQLVTTYAPEFMFTNFARDAQTALANISTEHGAKVAKTAAKNVFPSMRAMWNVLKNPNAQGKMEQFAREFRQDGGSIGFYSLKDIPTLSKGLESKIKTAGPGAQSAMRRAAGGFVDLVERANKSVENGTRLASYIALREAGTSRQKAAQVARNLTVNFTKKGEAGPTMNALYAFFNANVQGTKRLFDVLGTKRGAALAGTIIGSGYAMDAYNRAVAGDADNDGTNDYEAIPEYVKERNLVFMRGKGEKPILFPMPYGYNALHNVGRQANGVMSGTVTPAKAAASLGSTVWNAFNPLGGEADLVQTFAPTMLDPIVQDVTNKDFAGKPLRPTAYPGQSKPPSELYWKSAPPLAKDMAKFLNEKSGGDKVTPGYVSVSPETIDHYFKFLSGGLGRFGSNVANTAKSLQEGETPDIRNLPLARRFVYDAHPGAQAGKYRQNSEELDQLWSRYKSYREERNTTGLKSLPRDMLKAKVQVDAIDRQIRALKRAASSPRIEQKIEDLQRRANKLVEQARD